VRTIRMVIFRIGALVQAATMALQACIPLAAGAVAADKVIEDRNGGRGCFRGCVSRVKNNLYY
jgi:hypothetical protein